MSSEQHSLVNRVLCFDVLLCPGLTETSQASAVQTQQGEGARSAERRKLSLYISKVSRALNQISLGHPKISITKGKNLIIIDLFEYIDKFDTSD